MIKPKLCSKCQKVVNNIGKHKRRHRCEAQGLRKDTKPSRGLRHYGSKD